MTFLNEHLVEHSDYVSQRLRERIAGLTDDEYFWQPVPDCWTVHPVNGTVDGGPPFPDEPPFTTIAWRLTHIVDFLQTERTATWFGLTPAPDDGEPPIPGTAAAATQAFDHAVAVWRRRLIAVDDEQLCEKMGEIAGHYADSDRASFALHILDELIHHGAEVGVVRDLYRANMHQSG